MDYLDFSEIHEGDVLFEEGPGLSLQVKVLTEPEKKGDQWTFEGETSFGVISYLMTEGLSHYGPRLSREPTHFAVQLLSGEFADLLERT